MRDFDEIENLSEENINELYDDIIEGNLAYTLYDVYYLDYGTRTYLSSNNYNAQISVNYCTEQHCYVLADGYGTGCSSYIACNPQGAGRTYNAYFCITESVNR